MSFKQIGTTIYLIDPKSPLNTNDFQALFSVGTPLARMQVIAKKVGLITTGYSKSRLKVEIIEVLKGLNISEPIKMSANSKRMNMTTTPEPATPEPVISAPEPVIPLPSEKENQGVTEFDRNTKPFSQGATEFGKVTKPFSPGTDQQSQGATEFGKVTKPFNPGTVSEFGNSFRSNRNMAMFKPAMVANNSRGVQQDLQKIKNEVGTNEGQLNMAEIRKNLETIRKQL